MTENLNYLFQYLDKEKIAIDKNEFEFQIQSHPDYPSLLSIADTLRFFNIDNGAIPVELSEIDLLPNRFVALLKDGHSKSKLYYIENKNDTYFYTKDKNLIVITKEQLESRWDNLILLVEKSEDENVAKIDNSKWFWTLPLLCLLFFVAIVLQFQDNIQTKIFFLFPIIGVLFSVAALKDLFGTKSELLNSFCNLTGASSCETVVGSSKWKIFEIVNFSDLSIVFFASQFLGLIAFLLMGNATDYFNIQQLLLICAVPVLFASVYYQKFVEKKWCPICLVIIGIIILELSYVLFSQRIAFNFPIQPLVIFGFVYVAVTLVWTALKKLLTQQKELKEFQIKGNRFMRNYEIFKNTLLATDKTELAFSPIILGNKESDFEIAIITSPFCGYCKDAHEILEKIMSANKENIKIKIIINADIDYLDEEKKTFFRILMSIYTQNGEASFLEALHYWFNNKDLRKWLNIYSSDYDSEKIDCIYRLQNQWCITNNSYLTPSIFINGYRYPRTYERELLKFFVRELIVDQDF
jgi:thiol-disulfide isomerase/thioredoxin/uncharacterized membrane protein